METGSDTKSMISSLTRHVNRDLHYSHIISLRFPHAYLNENCGDARTLRHVLPGDILLAQEPRSYNVCTKVSKMP